MFIGVNNLARKIKNCYIGVDGAARKVKAVYVGVNGIARLVWQSIIKKVTSFSGQTSVGSADNGYSVTEVQHIYKVDDNHILLGTYSAYSGSLRRCFLYNCFLNDSGAVTSFTNFETIYEPNDSSQTNIMGITKFNDSIGACVYQVSGASSIRKICAFYLSGSNTKITEIQAGITGDLVSTLIPIGNNTIIVPTVSDAGYIYGLFYRYDNGVITNKLSMTLSPNIGYKDILANSTPVIFPLSNNRFCIISAVQQRYSTSEYYLVVTIYNYSFDSSNVPVITLHSNTIIPYARITKAVMLDNDYVVLTGDVVIGLHIDSNNGITYSNYLDFSPNICTRIGTSNSICSASGGTISVLYYDIENNTVSNTYNGTTNNTTKYYGVPYKNDSVLYGRGSSIVYLDKLTFS